MSKARQKVKVKTVNDASELGQMTKQQLLEESEAYDQTTYNPINNLTKKEMLIPNKKTEVVTIRLSPQENQVISDLADENGLSKSAFIRMVVKKAIKKEVQ